MSDPQQYGSPAGRTEPPDEWLEPPEGWVVSTKVEKHIAFYERGTGRTIALMPDRKGASGEWIARGVTGFDADFPLFAEGASLVDALQEAHDVMETTVSGGEIEPIATGRREGVPSASSTFEPPQSPAGRSALQADADGGDADPQASLSDWT